MMQQAPMVAQIQPMMQQQAQAGMQAQSVMQEIMAPAGDQQQAIQQAPAAAGQQPQQHQPQMVAMVQPIPGQAQQQQGRAMAAKNWRQPTLTMIMQRKVIKAPTPISSSTATETGEKPSTTTAWREERGKRNSHNMPGHANWLLRQQAATSARAAQQQTQQMNTIADSRLPKQAGTNCGQVSKQAGTKSGQMAEQTIAGSGQTPDAGSKQAADTGMKQPVKQPNASNSAIRKQIREWWRGLHEHGAIYFEQAVVTQGKSQLLVRRWKRRSSKEEHSRSIQGSSEPHRAEPAPTHLFASKAKLW